MRFLNTASLQDKRAKLAKMNDEMNQAGKSTQKSVVKQTFLESFIPMLEIISAAELDDKKFEKLWPQRYGELFKDET
jgi:hypothetical protein